MANWVELLNLYINYETNNKVGGLATSHANFTKAYLREQNNNKWDDMHLSRLVDIFILVRKYIQEEKYLDALISGFYGISIYEGITNSITTADLKLKASDIHLRLFETIVNLIKDNNLYQKITDSYAVTINELFTLLTSAKNEIKNREYNCSKISAVNTSLQVGQFLRLVDDSKYREIGVEDFYIDDILEIDNINIHQVYGTTVIYLRSLKNLILGISIDTLPTLPFDLIVPDPPSLLKHVDMFQRLTNEKFLEYSLGVIKKEMLSIRNAAFVKSNISTRSYDNAVLEYFESLKTIIKTGYKEISLNVNDDKTNSRVYTSGSYLIYLLIIIVIILIFYLASRT